LECPLWLIASVILVVFCVRIWNRTAAWHVRLGVLMLASVLVNPHLIVYDAAVLAFPLI
jgi:hypothetical protein